MHMTKAAKFTSSRQVDGFTLIELSIVLVIIGLIVGGILMGRDMIRAAELRSVARDVEAIKTAINTFQNKYNCLPGDCLNATQFFGQASSCPTPPVLTDPGTCNGDGNGNYLPWTNNEGFYADQQLVQAGLWGNGFAGENNYELAINGVTNGLAYIATNDLYDAGNSDGNNAVNGLWGNTINIASPDGGCDKAAPMSALDAEQIDTKMDDGHASTGKVFGLNGWRPEARTAPTCGVAATACLNGSNDYDTITDGASCRMIFYW